MSPCENCITLPVCKSRLDGEDFFTLMSMVDVCPSFKAFMKSPQNGDLNKFIDDRIEILRESLLKNINFCTHVKFKDRV